MEDNKDYDWEENIAEPQLEDTSATLESTTSASLSSSASTTLSPILTLFPSLATSTEDVLKTMYTKTISQDPISGIYNH
ncbi:hypothetical protein EVAR_71799_1 [Eumeta japonica]|uniref:Uncharacterized protein n=1 Tax=Eumeta variegata TaxID=151549 RepID=A0A4C1TD58_EUMVA|nr:hypothetical protein EVAR_71799_1 [Eumeta japonica]